MQFTLFYILGGVCVTHELTTSLIDRIFKSEPNITLWVFEICTF
jgi:hypothetical protein